MLHVPPITKGEFLQLFQKCIPPGGWSNRIAIANSGGPDSVCLLYLVSSLVRERSWYQGLPQGVVSIHVNHNLQDASTTMAEKAEEYARKLGLFHLTTVIPWGVHPFPARPEPGKPFENIAREARYNRLFQAMIGQHAHSVAFAHHADDQVETSVIRLSKGSSDLGASGMRMVRRWGMGAEEGTPLSWVGMEGMERFMVRPLLEVSKSRILATCEAHGLEYVTDPTNFQPEATLRNHIRHILSKKHNDPSSTSASRPELIEQATQIKGIIKNLGQSTSSDRGRFELRDAVRMIGRRVELVETRVTNFLARSLRHSPPSTLLIRMKYLESIQEHEVRIALVRRILRFVSPRPWGTLKAESNGNRHSFEQIIDKVWSLGHTKEMIARFSHGSRVLWTPLSIRRNGHIRWRYLKEDDNLAWLVHREPPWDPKRMERIGKSDTLHKDLSNMFRETKPNQTTIRALYDCRFLLEFDLDQMPLSISMSLRGESSNASIVVVPDTNFFLPRVVWRTQNYPEETLATVEWEHRSRWEREKAVPTSQSKGSVSTWIRMSPIRTWQAI